MPELVTYTIGTPGGATVVRFAPASEAIYDRFENDRKRDESAARTMLIKACVKSHNGADLDILFERYPAVKAALAVAIMKEAGGFLEFVEGEVLAS